MSPGCTGGKSPFSSSSRSNSYTPKSRGGASSTSKASSTISNNSSRSTGGSSAFGKPGVKLSFGRGR